MTSPLTLHAAPAAGFDQPFEMLAECHGRVERMLVLMERLAGHLRTHGPDAQARQAARDVLRYFDEAAPRHHEDEERHVFPRLEALGHGALAARLREDHVAMAQAWARVREDLAVIAAGRRLPVPAGLPAPLDGWPAFAALYRRHVGDEDGQAYPLAAAGIADEALRAMSADMAARRGVVPRDPPA